MYVMYVYALKYKVELIFLIYSILLLCCCEIKGKERERELKGKEREKQITFF